ncbi:hypothetical protein SARC_17484, partial [Sphaeroforma arctica JP610]
SIVTCHQQTTHESESSSCGTREAIHTPAVEDTLSRECASAGNSTSTIVTCHQQTTHESSASDTIGVSHTLAAEAKPLSSAGDTPSTKHQRATHRGDITESDTIELVHTPAVRETHPRACAGTAIASLPRPTTPSASGDTHERGDRVGTLKRRVLDPVGTFSLDTPHKAVHPQKRLKTVRAVTYVPISHASRAKYGSLSHTDASVGVPRPRIHWTRWPWTQRHIAAQGVTRSGAFCVRNLVRREVFGRRACQTRRVFGLFHSPKVCSVSVCTSFT